MLFRGFRLQGSAPYGGSATQESIGYVEICGIQGLPFRGYVVLSSFPRWQVPASMVRSYHTAHHGYQQSLRSAVFPQHAHPPPVCSTLFMFLANVCIHRT